MSQGAPGDGSNGDGRRGRSPNSRGPGWPQLNPPSTDGSHLRQAFTLLLQGYRYAEASGRSIWDYAIEMQDLKDMGLTNNDLRWMICREWVEHASEIPSPTEDSRAFEHEHQLRLSKSSCFVLTDPGVVVADQSCSGNMELIQSKSPSGSVSKRSRLTTAREAAPERKPRWDAERHRLYVGSVLVKEYKLPCPNQGMILMAFQEEDWPARIDDPLPPSADIDAKTRLSSTIKSLNKNLKNRLVHFMGDGSGEGVLWEFLVVKQPAH